MQSVFNTALLARLRRQSAQISLPPDRVESFEVKVVTDCDTLMRGTGAHRNYDQNIDGADEPDRIPVTVGDPDNDIDPDDLTTTVMRQSDDLSPPEMPPCTWWIRMTLDPPDTPVSVENALLAGDGSHRLGCPICSFTYTHINKVGTELDPQWR
jgi:hypothetical protein